MRHIAPICCWFFAAHLGSAATIDDFAIPASISSPEQSEEVVVTENVGSFLADRTIRIQAFGAEPPVASIGIQDGQATISHEQSMPTAHLHPHIVYGIDYDPPGPVDLTDDGRANAILVDVLSFQGVAAPFRISVELANEEGGRSRWSDGVLLDENTTEPFTLVFPFHEFHAQGASDPDFTRALGIGAASEWVFTQPSAPFEIQLGSIRTGIPEPTTMLLAWILALAAAVAFAARRNRR